MMKRYFNTAAMVAFGAMALTGNLWAQNTAKNEVVDPKPRVVCCAAHVVKMLDGRFFVNHVGGVAVMDKGEANGVQVGQVWQLVDEWARQPVEMKPYARVRVVQVFEKTAFVRLENATREVGIGAVLYPETAPVQDIKP